jgi:hypothetical protein
MARRTLAPEAKDWSPGRGVRLVYPPHFGQPPFRGRVFDGIWHISSITCGWGYKLRSGEVGETYALMIRAKDGRSFVIKPRELRFWRRVGREPNPRQYDRPTT